MTRVLFWNIKFFSINKINDQSSQAAQFASRQRLINILSTVQKSSADIFIILEVRADQGAVGSLMSSDCNGGQAVLLMLTALRTLTANWCLIPPLRMNPRDTLGLNTYTEAVAVFYRSDTLNFVGPYVMTNALNQIPVSAGGGAVPANYPAAWQACLPNNNNYAGQFAFVNSQNQALGFPSQNNRSPFLVRFTETGGANRTINLLAAHLPPNSTDAGTAFSRLFSIREMDPQAMPLANGEVRIVGGDFNLNTYSGVSTEQSTLDNPENFYGGYLRCIYRAPQGQQPYQNQNQGPTRYESVANATYDNYLRLEGLDNIYVLWNGIQPQNLSPAIIDLVSGAPAPNAFARMAIPLGALIQRVQQNQITVAQANGFFQQMDNFGGIGPDSGVSDHLPVFLEF